MFSEGKKSRMYLECLLSYRAGRGRDFSAVTEKQKRPILSSIVYISIFNTSSLYPPI